jgi:hypothetical protein
MIRWASLSLTLVVGLSGCTSRFLVGSLDLGLGSDLGADLASAACASAVAGNACSPEGASCGSCTDPCQFCNLLQCQGAKWQAVEAFPDPNCGKDMTVGGGADLAAADLSGTDMAGCPAAKPAPFSSCTNTPGTVTGPTCTYPTGSCTCADTNWVC